MVAKRILWLFSLLVVFSGTPTSKAESTNNLQIFPRITKSGELVICASAGGKYLPGTLSKQTKFTSYQDQIAKLELRLQTADPLVRKKLLDSLDRLGAKAHSQAKLCRRGPDKSAGILQGDNRCSIADFDHNGIIGFPDLSIFLRAYRRHLPQADLNADGVVNRDDLDLLLACWGVINPPSSSTSSVISSLNPSSSYSSMARSSLASSISRSSAGLSSAGNSSSRSSAGSSSQGSQPAYASSVTQYGITWTFDHAYQIGQFANGDWWALGPLVITSITPDFTGAQNGFEVNPSDIIHQGFDSRIPDFNAGLVPALPLSISRPASVVKAISKLDGICSYNTVHTCYLQTAAVLTVLISPPPDRGALLFRPGYFGAEKTWYSAAAESLHTELLPVLRPPDSNVPLISDLIPRVQRLQLDHKFEWIGRYLHPQDNMYDYGADIALDYDEIALRLMLNDDLQEKMPLLVYYLQSGIDHYSIYKNGGSWPANGGHNPGRKLPIAFAAALLNDENMKQAVINARKTLPADFDEDGGVYFSAVANNGNGEVLFGQGPTQEQTYWSVFRWNNAGGSKTFPDPYGYIDGCFRPGQSYDALLLGSWKGASLAAQMISETKRIWNNPGFFSHVERRVQFGMWTQPDLCAPMDGRCAGGSNGGGYCNTAGEDGTVCVDGLSQNDGWCNSYCPQGYCDYNINWPANYGVTYGPNGRGGCILDNNSSDGIGRFPLRHGSSRDAGVYQSAFVNKMWTAYYDYAAGNPVANFTETPRSGYIPLVVQFDASPSLDSDGYIVDYAWNFGDGGTANGRQVSHTFTSQGAFTVTLTVTDNSAKTDTFHDSVMVGDPYYVHEDFELMTDIARRAAPYGMDFEAVEGNGTIGPGGHSGISSLALLLPDFGAPRNFLVSNDGRNAWRNYTLNLRLGMGYVGDGGIVLHYQDPSNYYLLNLGTFVSNGRLERVVNGVKTIIPGTGNDITLPWGRVSAGYRITSSVSGSVNFTVVKDGGATRTFSDPNPAVTRGSIGFYALSPGPFNYLGADDIDLRIEP
jgi:PKD repeat protein